jgi:predicted acylesterase/phospholipase RssA
VSNVGVLQIQHGDRSQTSSFVCTVAKETAGVTRLRSYALPGEHDIPAAICEAALATSAATGFFDAVSIGGRKFIDGAIRANIPVDEVEGEATSIWCSRTGVRVSVKDAS